MAPSTPYYPTGGGRAVTAGVLTRQYQVFGGRRERQYSRGAAVAPDPCHGKGGAQGVLGRGHHARPGEERRAGEPAVRCGHGV